MESRLARILRPCHQLAWPSRYGELERGTHIVTRHIAGSKDKLADSVLLKSTLFEEVVTNAFVGGQEDPPLRTDHRQPSLIRSAPRKVSEVTLETDTELG